MLVELRQEAAGPSAVLRMDLDPGIDERPDQPTPDRPLMISRVARPQVAIILRLVIGMPWRQGAETERSKQTLPHHLNDRLPSGAVQHGMVQRNGENLIRTARRVVARRSIQHVEKGLL